MQTFILVLCSCAAIVQSSAEADAMWDKFPGARVPPHGVKLPPPDPKPSVPSAGFWGQVTGHQNEDNSGSGSSSAMQNSRHHSDIRSIS